jgi:hypothetical protein
LRNNASARDPEHLDFIRNELYELVETGAVEKLECKPWIVAPIQNVKREGKTPRLNLYVSRQVNDFIEVDSCKLVTLEKINENAHKGDYFASCDMSKGYFHLKINERYRDLFGFEFEGQY